MKRTALFRKTPLRRSRGGIHTTRRTPEDILWSEYIRTRDPICRLRFQCLGARTVEAAHIFDRDEGGTRLDPDNGIGTCWLCHRWADEHKTELRARAKQLLGPERYARIEVRSHLTAKQAGVEKVAVRAYLRNLLAQMEGRGR